MVAGEKKSCISNNILLFVLVLVAFSQCKSVPDIAGFKADKWKEDVNGCDGKRIEMSIGLEQERQKLKGLAESDLVRMLGNPNEVEVLERQQKYYIYWIQNPKLCPGSKLEYKELKIRLSAIGRVTETLFN